MPSPALPRLARGLARAATRTAVPRTARAPRLSSSSGQRGYHSYDHPPPPSPFSDVEQSILAAAYTYIPEHGFSRRALGLGARDAGYLDISPSVLADGPFSLIRYHLVTQRQSLAARDRQRFQGDAQLGVGVGVGARVAALTWERLMGNRDIIHQWQEALAIMAQPGCLPSSLKELAALSDEIWFLSGDKAVDPSWYTKRAALSMVYSSSELFMTNDASPGFINTNKFLHGRLDEVQLVGSSLGSVGQCVGFALNAGINVLRSKGAPI